MEMTATPCDVSRSTVIARREAATQPASWGGVLAMTLCITGGYRSTFAAGAILLLIAAFLAIATSRVSQVQAS